MPLPNDVIPEAEGLKDPSQNVSSSAPLVGSTDMADSGESVNFASWDLQDKDAKESDEAYQERMRLAVNNIKQMLLEGEVTDFFMLQHAPKTDPAKKVFTQALEKALQDTLWKISKDEAKGCWTLYNSKYFVPSLQHKYDKDHHGDITEILTDYHICEFIIKDQEEHEDNRLLVANINGKNAGEVKGAFDELAKINNMLMGCNAHLPPVDGIDEKDHIVFKGKESKPSDPTLSGQILLNGFDDLEDKNKELLPKFNRRDAGNYFKTPWTNKEITEALSTQFKQVNVTEKGYESNFEFDFKKKDKVTLFPNEALSFFTSEASIDQAKDPAFHQKVMTEALQKLKGCPKDALPKDIRYVVPVNVGTHTVPLCISLNGLDPNILDTLIKKDSILASDLQGLITEASGKASFRLVESTSKNHTTEIKPEVLDKLFMADSVDKAEFKRELPLLQHSKDDKSPGTGNNVFAAFYAATFLKGKNEFYTPKSDKDITKWDEAEHWDEQAKKDYNAKILKREYELRRRFAQNYGAGLPPKPKNDTPDEAKGKKPKADDVKNQKLPLKQRPAVQHELRAFMKANKMSFDNKGNIKQEAGLHNPIIVEISDDPKNHEVNGKIKGLPDANSARAMVMALIAHGSTHITIETNHPGLFLPYLNHYRDTLGISYNFDAPSASAAQSSKTPSPFGTAGGMPGGMPGMF